MIEVLRPEGPTEFLKEVTFEQIQSLVGGYVELVAILEQGKEIHCCCNENGFQEGLPPNPLATARFSGKINMGPGAVGTWVILSGKDLLK